jgi:hypothetical protein
MPGGGVRRNLGRGKLYIALYELESLQKEFGEG